MVRLNPEVTKKFMQQLTQREQKTHKEQGHIRNKGTKGTMGTEGTQGTIQVRWRLSGELAKEIKLKAIKEGKSLEQTVKEVITKGLK